MLRFKVILEVITPIHIGCGEEYYPVDYFIDDEEKRLYVVDENKLLNSVEKEGKIDEFANLAAKYTATNDALLRFIRKRAKNNSAYSVEVEDNAAAYIKSNEGAFRAPISRFIRNSYNSEVYIPGSTIKGSLRSAFIEMVMKRLEKRYGTENRMELAAEFKKEFGSDLCSQLEAFLNVSGNPKNAKSDVMRFFKVSDFVCKDSIQRVYKVFAIKRPIEDGTREVQDIPDVLECIDKGSVFEGTIEVDEGFLKEMNEILKGRFRVKEINKISANNIAMWIRNFYRIEVWGTEKEYFQFDSDAKFYGADEYVKYEGNFKRFGRGFVYPTEPKNGFMIKVGKHGGAVSKTISGCRRIRVKGLETPQDHQTTLWLAGGLPMGWIKGRIEDAN